MTCSVLSEGKWRKESIKAYGNAWVPQVALEILVHRSVSSASFSVPWEQYLQSCRLFREHFSNEIVQTVRQSALSVRRDAPHTWILTVILHIQGNASAVTPALQSAQGKIFIQALLLIKINNY